MKKNEKIIVYTMLVFLTLLVIVNIIFLLRIDGNSSSVSNTKQSSIKVSDDTTKVVNEVNDSVVTIALYQGSQMVGNGSGSIISASNNKAKIVTNNHVVDQNENIKIKVVFANKKEIDAKVLGKDAISDLALLEVPINFKVKPISLGNSDKLQVGEPVIAIGSPLNIEFKGTVTKGIISGLNRTIETDTNGDNIPDYAMQVIQTDTTINPGNSGGPLINMAGQMIGINTSKINMDGFEGMGFAIPINEAKSILEQLEKNGKVERPKLGVSYQPISSIPDFSRSELKIPKDLNEGLYIIEVLKGSPAAKSGLKPDDIIVEVNGSRITSPSVFTSKLYSSKPGDKLKLTVYRNGEKININVVL